MIKTGWELPDKAFEWIEENIPFGSTIVELGSGHGSKRLSSNYDLWSIEHDTGWLNLYSSNYIHAEIVPFEINGESGSWYNPEKIKKALPSNYSLLIIDGPPSSIGRKGVLAHHEIFFWGCHILVDDTHRLEEKNISDQLSLQKSLNKIHFKELFEQTGLVREFTVLSP